MPAAPMAAGPSGATMMVSTMPMLIQPSSASTTGSARRSIGASSERNEEDIDGRAAEVANRTLPDSVTGSVTVTDWHESCASSQ